MTQEMTNQTNRFMRYMQNNPIQTVQDIGDVMEGIHQHRLPNGHGITRKERSHFYEAAQKAFGITAMNMARNMGDTRDMISMDTFENKARLATALFRASNASKFQGRDEEVTVATRAIFASRIEVARKKAEKAIPLNQARQHVVNRKSFLHQRMNVMQKTA